jgi:hypothetical protein
MQDGRVDGVCGEEHIQKTDVQGNRVGLESDKALKRRKP